MVRNLLFSCTEALAEQAKTEAVRTELSQKEGLVSEQQPAKATADAASAKASVDAIYRAIGKDTAAGRLRPGFAVARDAGLGQLLSAR